MGPKTHVLQEISGVGRTEAVVLLIHRPIAKGCTDEFHIGLSTTAANVMCECIAGVWVTLFEMQPTSISTPALTVWRKA